MSIFLGIFMCYILCAFNRLFNLLVIHAIDVSCGSDIGSRDMFVYVQ